jgi:hypothetical protein
MNVSSQSTYTHDLIYLFFKSFLFLILGIVFYYLFKNESPAAILDQVKEKAGAVANAVDQTAKAVKDKIKPKAES